MRIVSYNILAGGEGRADPLAEVIAAQRPDVAGLVEATDPAVLARIAGRLAMDYIQAEGEAGASALLSRWPIVRTINHGVRAAAVGRGMLEAIVRTPDGMEVTVAVVHLCPHGEDTSPCEAEAGAVLALLEPARTKGGPHVLMGGFGAGAIQQILDAGYIDTLAALDPARAAESGTFSTQSPQHRPDRIFAWGVPSERIASAWVERDRLAKYASDHFPAGAELRIRD